MLAAERDELRSAARGALARRWPEATVAADPAADLVAAVWSDAVALGWTDLAGVPDAVVVIAEELGRVACPLPVADAAATATAFAGRPDLVAAVVAGEVRPTLADDGLAELGNTATHALTLTAGQAALAPITAAVALDGLARPPWTAVDLAAPSALAPDADGSLAAARRLLRVALVARAMGAARRAHELARQYAVDRHQFGRPIGAYQAVAHRLADAATDLAGWDALTARLDDGPLVVDAAVAHGSAAAVRVVRAAQRTLAAIGYFEEHELPWLFRRAHADLVRAGPPEGADAVLGAALLAGERLVAPDLGPEASALVARLERDLDDLGVAESTSLDDDPALVEELGRRGWIAPGLPREQGGLDAGVAAQMAVDAVVHRRRVPVRVARGVAATLAGVIGAHGSADQRDEMLPRIAAGQFRCYLGYSEPDVGSDLAALQTRARRDGDEWVVDGTKLWGTGAHRADYVWLAARTNPDAPRRAGITVFLAPTGLPGWSCSEHRALSGEVSCTTVFDGVRIPDSCRVGPVDGGWPVITAALAAERVVMAGLAAEVGRQLDDLVGALRRRGGTADPLRAAAAPTIGRLAARHQAALGLLGASAEAVDLGGGWLEAAMAKVVTGDLADDVAHAAVELLGVEAATGPFDHALRLAPMYVIGGGTADIQRNLVARGLGLPRS